MFKIGLGYDVHRFVKGRDLYLGGMKIPHTHGLEGHSDADVVLHAICDAILGALAKGDIGEHFPNNDERYRNISSLKLLKKVDDLAREAGYQIGNVDAVILAEAPNLKAFKSEMRTVIGRELRIAESCVNIKATTNEGLGFVGRGEGIAAYATVLLQRSGGVS